MQSYIRFASVMICDVYLSLDTQWDCKYNKMFKHHNGKCDNLWMDTFLGTKRKWTHTRSDSKHITRDTLCAQNILRKKYKLPGRILMWGVLPILLRPPGACTLEPLLIPLQPNHTHLHILKRIPCIPTRYTNQLQEEKLQRSSFIKSAVEQENQKVLYLFAVVNER